MVVRLVHEYLDELVGPNDVEGVPVNRPKRVYGIDATARQRR
jgi:hypothetical protein